MSQWDRHRITPRPKRSHLDQAYAKTQRCLQGFNAAMVERLTDEFMNEMNRQRQLHQANPALHDDPDAWLKPHCLSADGSDIVVDIKKWNALSARGQLPPTMVPTPQYHAGKREFPSYAPRYEPPARRPTLMLMDDGMQHTAHMPLQHDAQGGILDAHDASHSNVSFAFQGASPF